MKYVEPVFELIELKEGVIITSGGLCGPDDLEGEIL